MVYWVHSWVSYPYILCALSLYKHYTDIKIQNVKMLNWINSKKLYSSHKLKKEKCKILLKSSKKKLKNILHNKNNRISIVVDETPVQSLNYNSLLKKIIFTLIVPFN